MVDVSEKADTAREAVAKGCVYVSAETLALVLSGTAKKGDVLTTAQLAGIMAAKRTHDLIPLCHPLPLTGIEVSLAPHEERIAIEITATVRTTAKTGVEMEALTAVSVAALTVYDMLKAAQKDMRIGDIQLVRKTGGKRGDMVVEAADPQDTLLLHGFAVTDCRTKLSRFCLEDLSYRSYDQVHVVQDNELTSDDIRVANRLVARMGAGTVAAIAGRSEEISRALADIDPLLSLAEWNPDLRFAVERLFGAILQPHVGLARATKVLHKKRPQLIPILDDMVLRYTNQAARNDGRQRATSEMHRGLVAMDVLHEDYVRNQSLLNQLASEFRISGVRVLDILIWAWSGVYQPVWAR
jgi:cyclic pyranopterin phosphate synthase